MKFIFALLYIFIGVFHIPSQSINIETANCLTVNFELCAKNTKLYGGNSYSIFPQPY